MIFRCLFFWLFLEERKKERQKK